MSGFVPNFGASGSAHARGAVPDPGSTSGITKFLREDASWELAGGGLILDSTFTGPGSPADTLTVPIPSGYKHLWLDFLLQNSTGHTLDLLFNGSSAGSISYLAIAGHNADVVGYWRMYFVDEVFPTGSEFKLYAQWATDNYSIINASPVNAAVVFPAGTVLTSVGFVNPSAVAWGSFSQWRLYGWL